VDCQEKLDGEILDLEGVSLDWLLVIAFQVALESRQGGLSMMTTRTLVWRGVY
jgi:hypothetical protein